MENSNNGFVVCTMYNLMALSNQDRWQTKSITTLELDIMCKLWTQTIRYSKSNNISTSVYCLPNAEVSALIYLECKHNKLFNRQPKITISYQ